MLVRCHGSEVKSDYGFAGAVERTCYVPGTEA